MLTEVKAGWKSPPPIFIGYPTIQPCAAKPCFFVATALASSAVEQSEPRHTILSSESINAGRQRVVHIELNPIGFLGGIKVSMIATRNFVITASLWHPGQH
jgi:hypothetical protein